MSTIKAWSAGLGAWSLMMISAAFGQTASDLNEGLRVVKQPSGSAYTLQWWGKLGRSYFLEQSPDLVNWTYAPVVFGGAAQVSGLGLNTTAERLFWRLRHTDAQNGGNAQLADFDADGVTNLDEVTTGRNPFVNADANTNGLPDDWEGFNAGKFACYSAPLNVSLAQGGTTTRVLTLRNDTAQAVNWSLDMQDLLAGRWLNSNTGGPAYTWEEISGTGTLLLPASNYISHSQPVSLTQFTFPFFGTSRSTLQVCTEGYIDFTTWLPYGSNRSFPAYDRPPSMIAGFWDDLDPFTSGDIYFQEFSDHCVIEYQNVARSGWPGTVTFQIVLFASRAFEVRYHTLATAANSCTVGFQDLDHGVAETLVYNQNYLTSNLRLRWERLPFLSATATSGTVPAHSSATVTLAFDATHTEAGRVHYPAITLSHSGTGGSPRRLPASLTVTGMDADNDGLPDFYENAFGLNPAVNDAALDRDLDGLTNYQEYLLGTVPNQPDSDYDEMNDGWEQLYGFPPLVSNATDADPTNDLTADPDNDGLLNSQEEQIGTNPRSSDTDGDTYSDVAENTGASNTTSFASTPPNPGGNPAGPPANPPPSPVPVSVTFGDHSVSHSEKYRVVLEPLEGDLNTQKRYRTNSKYGAVQTPDPFYLPRGAKYKVTFVHIGTDPKYKEEPRPDYDYTLDFPTAQEGVVPVNSPQAILGVHDESYDFFAEGKSATLYVPDFDWVTPKGSPVSAADDSGDGKNEFTYSTASTGVLTMDLKMLVKPAGCLAATPYKGQKLKDRCKFILPQVSGSTFAWDPLHTDGKPTVTGDNLICKATFTTLPANNSDFGAKQAEFQRDGAIITNKGDFEVFFPRDATNHPGTSAGSDPNWFYYWKDGGVCGIPGTALYDSTASFGYTLPGTDSILRLGPDAPTTNTGPETYVGAAPYGSVTVTGTGKGIKCVAETITHELHHLTIYNALGGRADSDGDSIANADEAT
jgi:hypothetical protein